VVNKQLCDCKERWMNDCGNKANPVGVSKCTCDGGWRFIVLDGRKGLLQELLPKGKEINTLKYSSDSRTYAKSEV